MNKQEMISKLLEASDAYYNKSIPIMSDCEYDELYDEFKSEYPGDPFLKTIGAPVDPASEWEKATHKIPMGSLNKVVNINEFSDWTNKHDIHDVVVSEKLDGISLSIEYENGKLIKAITRGDGKIGENITKNVLKMQNVRKVLAYALPGEDITSKLISFTGSLRGEIILKQNDFDTIVFLQKQRGEEPLKNMRNGASGIAKRYDGKYSEFLSVVYYDITIQTNTKTAKFRFIEKMYGLPTSFVRYLNVRLMNEIYTQYEDIKRAKLDYEIDGLVIECNDLEKYKELGEKDNRPKGAIAFKFTSLKKETTIKDITWQLGKSGTLTPVAELEPIDLGGVTVKRASLHNLENFKYMNLHYGDIVLVSRRNDVIPYVEKVVSSLVNNKVIEPITNCPVCGSVVAENGKFLVCPNENCDGAYIGNLVKWINVTGMHKLGIGEKTIEKLYDTGLIFDPSDLYELKVEEIEILDGFGKRSAEKLVEIIQSKKEISLSQFIGGLNIKNFSTNMVDLLIENGYDSLQKISYITFDKLVKIKGIEEKTATNFLDNFEKKKFIMSELFDVGVKIKEENNTMKTSDSKLNGMSFCFTGAVQATNESGERYTRSILENMVKENGGEIKGVSNGLTYLVQADPSSTSSKSEKAKKLGVEIISDVDFLKMVK